METTTTLKNLFKGILLFAISFARFGDAQTPRLVRNISYSSGSSSPLGMTAYGGKVYFRADDGAKGPGNNAEYWVTDGSYYGTKLVKDINTQTTGNSSSSPGSFTVFNSKLYFSARQSSTAGFDLWQSDGTDAGTVVHQSAGTVTNPRLWVVNGSTMYFVGGGSSTSYLYKTNGTTVTQITNFTQNNVGPLFNVGTKFIYGASTSTNNQLWISDGTLAGTTLLATLGTSGWYPLPTDYCVFGGKVYFSAEGTNNDEELWVTDGTSTGTALFKNINPASIGSTPRNLIVFNNKLYFTCNNGTNGIELWTSDGTTTGTVLVSDLNPGSASSSPGNLMVFGGKLYFTATTATLGTELFSCSTTNVITNVKDIASGTGNSSPDYLTNYNGTLYFSANDGTNGVELWKSDGTAVGTTMVSNLNPGAASSSPANLMVSGSNLFFSANDGVKGVELYVINPTALPTLSISATSTNLVCGGSTTITASGSSTSYNWSTGASGASITVTPTQKTTYYVEGISSTGSIKLDSIKINVTPAGGITLTSSAGSDVCYGTPTTISASGVPSGSTYDWGYEQSAYLYPYGITTSTLTKNPSGSSKYYLMSTKPNGCLDTTYITVVGHFQPLINISPTYALIVCEGTPVTLTASGAGTSNYTWSNGGTGNSITFTPASSTSLTAVGTDVWGCSGTSAAKAITVNPMPVLSTIPGSRCGSGTVVLGASTSVGTLNWYSYSGSSSVLGTGTSFTTATLTSSYSYYVKAVSGSCSTAYTPVLATINANPSVGITQTGNTLSLLESGATYQWFTCPSTNINGATSQSYTPTVSGSYGATVTKNGCTLTVPCQTIVITSEMESQELNEAIQLAPNPVQDKLLVTLKEIQYQSVQLTIYTIQGQPVFQTELNGDLEIDASSWKKGVYWLELVSGEKVFRKQLLKSE